MFQPKQFSHKLILLEKKTRFFLEHLLKMSTKSYPLKVRGAENPYYILYIIYGNSLAKNVLSKKKRSLYIRLIPLGSVRGEDQHNPKGTKSLHQK